MSDLISRQAIINMKGLFEDWNGEVCEGVLVEDIEQLPSAEPKKGKWEVKTDGFIFKRKWGICSECGNYLDFLRVNVGRGDANFCPNCGAKMIEEEE